MNISKKFFISMILIALLIGAVATGLTMQAMDTTANDPTTEKETDGKEETDSKNDQEEESESKETKTPDEFQSLDRAIDLIQANFVNEVERQELINGAIEGMVSELDDPYSEYLNAEMTKQFNQSLESSFEGIGAEVTKRDEHITIIAPLKGSPAEEAGIRPNDRVIEVDGESVEDYTVYEATSLIRGEKGTDVVLTIDRPGVEEPIEITITRDTIPLTTVYSDVMEQDGKKVGVLEIRSFGEGTAKEFNDQLLKLEDEENIEGLVIDVRGNPGGLFDSVESILANFLGPDDPFVMTERRGEKGEAYYTNGQGRKDYPIAVLVNEGSASASEILAAAFKEVVESEIIGETTFGKGTVQQAMELGDGMLKVTVMNWLSPHGNQINEVGVEPTIEVKQPDYFYTTLIQTDEPLKYNMNGAEVEKAQIMLKGLGYEMNRTDGYFDKQTTKAVEGFQKEHDLNVTGEINEKTEEKLETLILEAVENPENDRQLKRAVEEITGS
ncbi:S41 family peptidase [Allobacillus sp. GCM10007491]|uniref:Peptidoglycan-binding protein n=1 Tax=Allobacillus saliphilus TaxID=2912308 RepID=A0A941CRZ2_9BACI|nr:S41 family peptidase [Allobacillus saliphilus]MBR7552702.1 peptidoglycan-binding protein [Allobacillus saliphilus]